MIRIVLSSSLLYNEMGDNMKTINENNLEINTQLFHDEETYVHQMFKEDDYSGLTVFQIDMKNCVIKDMALTDSTYDHCYFVDVVFDHCDLSNTTFRETLFRHVQFINCKMLGLHIDESLIEVTTFQQCLMHYSSFYKDTMK